MTEEEPSTEALVEQPASSFSQSDRARILSAFWILGLCNNFGYVVMLSAAHDILTSINGTAPINNGTDNITSSENRTGKLISECNPISTGAVLLADILPTLIVKLTAPFYVQILPYWLRVGIVVVCGLLSFPIVAVSQAVWISLVGVVLSSISSGFGEFIFLSLASHFERDVVSTWSSGTGGAGVFGALSYAGLLAIGLSTRSTLFLMMLIPTFLGLTYFFLLVKPQTVHTAPETAKRASQSNVSEAKRASQSNVSEKDALLAQAPSQKSIRSEPINKIQMCLPLLPYMLPLAIVYFAEYFINQGLQELIYFDDIEFAGPKQYRWYQVIYQVGVLISRSSVNCIRIRRVWIIAVLQCFNVVLILLEVFLKFIPSIWIMFALFLYEGFLGGAAYVNTFYTLTQDVKEEDREYSMGVVSIADSIGISLAGAVSIPVHNEICTLNAYSA